MGGSLGSSDRGVTNDLGEPRLAKSKPFRCDDDDALSSENSPSNKNPVVGEQDALGDTLKRCY